MGERILQEGKYPRWCYLGGIFVHMPRMGVLSKIFVLTLLVFIGPHWSFVVIEFVCEFDRGKPIVMQRLINRVCKIIATIKLVAQVLKTI